MGNVEQFHLAKGATAINAESKGGKQYHKPKVIYTYISVRRMALARTRLG